MGCLYQLRRQKSELERNSREVRCVALGAFEIRVGVPGDLQIASAATRARNSHSDGIRRAGVPQPVALGLGARLTCIDSMLCLSGS